MDSNGYLLIKKEPDHGWSVIRCGQTIGTASNIVEAIDFANRLALRDLAIFQRETRVVLVEDYL